MPPKPATGLKRVFNYIRYDLREIIIPSSLPNPPEYVAPPPLTLREAWHQLQYAVRGYIDSWNSEKLHAALKERGKVDDDDGESVKAVAEDVLADFSAAAKGGSKALKPFLQNLYQTRVVAYRDAAQNFIQGYKEGFQEGSKDDLFTSNDNQTLDEKEVKATEGTSLYSTPPSTVSHDNRENSSSDDKKKWTE